MTTGERIRMWRERRGMTQEQLGAAAGRHQVSLSNIETGAAQPTVQTLQALARALNCSVSDLLGEAARRSA